MSKVQSQSSPEKRRDNLSEISVRRGTKVWYAMYNGVHSTGISEASLQAPAPSNTFTQETIRVSAPIQTAPNVGAGDTEAQDTLKPEDKVIRSTSHTYKPANYGDTAARVSTAAAITAPKPTTEKQRMEDEARADVEAAYTWQAEERRAA